MNDQLAPAISALEQTDQSVMRSVGDLFAIVAPIWLQKYQDIRWLYTQQNAPMPKRPFGTIQMIHKKNESIHTLQTHKLEEIVTNIYSIMFYVNIYGDNANHILNDLLMTFQCQEVLNYSIDRCIAYRSNQGVEDLTGLINKSWEERALSKVMFDARYQRKRVVDNMKILDITGKLNNVQHLHTKIIRS